MGLKAKEQDARVGLFQAGRWTVMPPRIPESSSVLPLELSTTPQTWISEDPGSPTPQLPGQGHMDGFTAHSAGPGLVFKSYLLLAGYPTECLGCPTSHLCTSVSEPIKWDKQAHIWGQSKDCMLEAFGRAWQRFLNSDDRLDQARGSARILTSPGLQGASLNNPPSPVGWPMGHLLSCWGPGTQR